MNTWSVDQVVEWIKFMGLGLHERKFRENDISGDVLVHADHNMLKELDIKSVGHRLNLLRAIYGLKISQGIPFDQDDWVPESSSWASPGLKGGTSSRADDKPDPEEYARLKAVVKQQDQSIHRLAKEIEHLSAEMVRIREDLSPVWSMVKEYEEFEQKKKSGRNDIKRSLKLPTPGKGVAKTPSKLPSAVKVPSNTLTAELSSAPNSARPGRSGNVSAVRIYTDRQMNRENEPYKTVQVSMEDTCAEILPEILRKYKIRNDWQHYALFMRHKGSERCLSFDERPLALIQELKDESTVPTFTLKHIKQVTSPASRLSENPIISSRGGDIPPSGVEADREHLPNAVAVYEYQATLEDEVDVAIGDRFKIVRRERGWCIVEKEGKLGWVPEGCLAQSERDDFKTAEDPGVATQKGVALYDYTKISPNELSIKKGDQLLVRNKYEHWLLAECRGESGWVPSCYVTIHEAGDAEDADTLGNTDKEDFSILQNQAVTASPIAPQDDDLDMISGSLYKRQQMGQSTGIRRSMSTEDIATMADKTKSAITRSRSNTLTAVSKLSSLIDSINPYIGADMKGPRSAPAVSGSGADRLSSVLQEITGILLTFQKDTVDDPVENRLHTSLELVGILATEVETSANLMEDNEKYGAILERLQGAAQTGKMTLARLSNEQLAQEADIDDDNTPLYQTARNANMRKASIENAYNALTGAVDIIMRERSEHDWRQDETTITANKTDAFVK
ncbi:hypothetical protein SpCBS45565_g07251 [Spizellomyces sp. 'palustris']|nr:hypothetical protein SpCBS45565_g07251 [Spizellomyces sp. 'palustris']